MHFLKKHLRKCILNLKKIKKRYRNIENYTKKCYKIHVEKRNNL